MAVVSYDSGKLLGLANIGDSPDAAGYDPEHGLAFSSNGDGTLSVIDTKQASFPTIQTVQTSRGARTMAFDSTNGRIFLSSAKFGPAPAAATTTPRPRPTVTLDSFEVLVLSR